MRLCCAVLCGFTLHPGAAFASSQCVGSWEQGALRQGVQLPSQGANFSAYSDLGVMLGRNYVHDKVATVLLDAYEQVAKQAPELRFVYGETGFAEGGPFKPHKTHQNGLSADFFVPVRTHTGEITTLSISPLNKFGYAIEFDQRGQTDDFKIDFQAMALHLQALADAAKRHGVGIRRVIFDHPLQPLLFAVPKGQNLNSRLTFSTKKPWVRHDEHYHVDFIVPCVKR